MPLLHRADSVREKVNLYNLLFISATIVAGEIAEIEYPNALCFTYSVVLSPHFRALDWILSFSLAVTRTAIRTSFPIHISPFGGLGATPPKSQPISAVIGTFVAHKVPACYSMRHTL